MPRRSAAEVGKLGRALYEQRLRAMVESAEQIGKEIVIDVDSGDYEIDEDGLRATDRLRARHPDADIYGIRIGYSAVYSLDGPLERTVR